MNLALGLIETKGLVGAIEAADAMVKAADVKIISKEKVTGALICIKVMGETAAVKSSIDAGSAAAQRVGELVSAHVIPRPDDQIDQLLFDDFNTPSKKKRQKDSIKEIQKEKPKAIIVEKEESLSDVKKEKTAEKKVLEPLKEKEEAKIELAKKVKAVNPNLSRTNVPSMEQLVVLNVHALRRIARGVDNFPIKGRDISKANRAKLLDYFKGLQ